MEHRLSKVLRQRTTKMSSQLVTHLMRQRSLLRAKPANSTKLRLRVWGTQCSYKEVGGSLIIGCWCLYSLCCKTKCCWLTSSWLWNKRYITWNMQIVFFIRATYFDLAYINLMEIYEEDCSVVLNSKMNDGIWDWFSKNRTTHHRTPEYRLESISVQELF